MKKVILFILVVSVFCNLKAQVKTRYFLNQREIAPQSVSFLDPLDIDSIKTYPDSRLSKDTAIVLYTKNENKIMNLSQLLDYFYIDSNARNFPVEWGTFADFQDRRLLVFSKDMVPGISVRNELPVNTKILFIQPNIRHWNLSSEVDSKMLNLLKKYNHFGPANSKNDK